MKTTLDLPKELPHDVKLRALQEGKKLKDEVAELLRRGLSVPLNLRSSDVADSPRIGVDPQTGLPVILCGADAPISKMTLEEILQMEQDAQTKEDLERAGISS